MLLRRCSSEPTARRRRTATTSLPGGSPQILQTVNLMAAAATNTTTRSSSSHNNNTASTTALVDNHPGLPGAPAVVDIVWPVAHPPMAPHSSRVGPPCADGDADPAVLSDSAMIQQVVAIRAPFCGVASETVASVGVEDGEEEEEVEQFEPVSANETSSPTTADLAVAAATTAAAAAAVVVEVPTERPVCCGVANAAPTTPALAPPPCETPASATSATNAASAAQAPPARAKVPTTAPGTCMVCLADSEEIVGAAWLHRESTITAVAAAAADTGGGETECVVSACVSCLKTYFEGIVAAGFDGACPRMRCMCCPRLVCQWAWAPLVDPAVFEKFKQRAATLLSLQCGSCHSRGSAMVVPPADHSYSLALEKMMADIATNLEGSREPAGEEVQDANDVKDNGSSNGRIEAFRLAFERYLSGEDVDVVKIYDEVEVILSLAFAEGLAKDRHSRMVDVLRCVEDNERRASLHIRFLRFHPMMGTVCCDSWHCFRCRVKGGHPSVTCEQYEAQRAHEDVYQCPGCGVYVVKGDGCNAITCVCGESFSWDTLVRERDAQTLNIFRAAHTDNPARAAVIILRQDSLGFREGETRAAEVAAVDEDCEQTGEDVGGGEAAALVAHEPHLVQASVPEPVQESVPEPVQEPVPEPVQGPVPEPVQEPVPEPVQDTPLLAPGSAEELRLAQMFATTYQRDYRIARAELYGEENPHFTVLRALHQANRSSDRMTGALDFFGRARTVTPNEAELAWEAASAWIWIRENRSVARGVSQREAAARLSLVEAFYGNETSGDNIAHVHVAAEHSRYALCAAAIEPARVPLFDWLGIRIRSSAQNEEAETPSSQPPSPGDRVTPVAPPRISGGDARPLPPPATIWGPRPPRRFTPPRATCPPLVSTRNVSVVSSFGSQQLKDGVYTWLGSCEERRRRLSRQMALEEDRLSRAWVALWGRRSLFGAAKVPAGADQDPLEEQRAVEMAARRVAFLQVYPEQLSAEQGTMLKAFLRRHWAVTEQVCEVVVVQRAAAWEEMHSSSCSPLDSAEQGSCTHRRGEPSSDGNDHSGSATDVVARSSCCFSRSFKRGYEAYLSYSERRSAERQSVADNARNRSLSKADRKRSRSLLQAGGKRDGGVVVESLEERALESLASAWESHNRPRIGAVRFADTHAEQGTASVAAVLVLCIVPVLVRRNRMCDCKLEAAEQDATWWRQFNSEAFDVEFARARVCEEAGAKVLEGCECEGHKEACSRELACPTLVRRVLKVRKPLCNCAAQNVFDEDGFLSSIFG